MPLLSLMAQEQLSRSDEETKELARQFALTLTPGDTICLCGTLGAGKTVFSKGLAEGLGVKEALQSPTFSIVNSYNGVCKETPISLYHIDLYRLEQEHDVYAVGFEDYFTPTSIVVVEWGDKFKHLLPKRHKRVEIIITGKEERLVRVHDSKMI